MDKEKNDNIINQQRWDKRLLNKLNTRHRYFNNDFHHTKKTKLSRINVTVKHLKE